VDGKRCGGEWKERISPDGRIDVLINEIPHRTEEIVMENLADVNHQIKQGLFTRNLASCTSPFPCPFFKLCWNNSKEDLIDMNEEVKDEKK
jgi:hypothetical protein